MTNSDNAIKLQKTEKNLDSLCTNTEKLGDKLEKLELNDELSQATNVIVDSLCKMFMRSAFNLKYLILSPYDANKDIPKSSIFIDNEPGLANLRKLKLRFYTNTLCQHEKRGNLYELLKLLPNICNGLIHLDINRIKIPNHAIAEILAGLIMSQPELTYCRFYRVYGDSSILINVLPVHKLTNLVLDDVAFTRFSLASLSQCTRLECLVLRKCRSITLETIQPILKASIRLKFLHLSELSKEVIKAIIVKAGDALEQVSIKFTSDDINEGLEALASHCQKITHLSLSHNLCVNITSVISNINLLKNLGHLKLSFGIIDQVGLDDEFSKLELEKLQYLELINIGIKSLQGYLSKRCSPLSTIIIDDIEESDLTLKIFSDFSKEKNSLRWVGIDDINFLDKYLEICKINEVAEGFKLFPAKQVRIREKYF